MRNHVRHVRGERIQPSAEEGHERGLVAAAPFPGTDAENAENAEDTVDTEDAEYAEDTADGFDEDFAEVVRLACPDCGRPITVPVEGHSLPEHALCPTPWNPFGLTVCAGSGRAVADARPLDGAEGEHEPETLAVVLTLPAGLDWRTQPFSHVGGPGSRPIRPAVRPLAA